MINGLRSSPGASRSGCPKPSWRASARGLSGRTLSCADICWTPNGRGRTNGDATRNGPETAEKNGRCQRKKAEFGRFLGWFGVNPRSDRGKRIVRPNTCPTRFRKLLMQSKNQRRKKVATLCNIIRHLLSVQNLRRTFGMVGFYWGSPLDSDHKLEHRFTVLGRGDINMALMLYGHLIYIYIDRIHGIYRWI